jgi:hypothetical protein
MPDEPASSSQGENALVAAADLLDTEFGPRFFTDFSKAVMHPRSVVEVPFITQQGQLCMGFGDLKAGQVGTLAAFDSLPWPPCSTPA